MDIKRLQELRERRAALRTKAAGIQQAVEKEDRAWKPEETADFETAIKEIDALNQREAKIMDAAKLDETNEQRDMLDALGGDEDKHESRSQKRVIEERNAFMKLLRTGVDGPALTAEERALLSPSFEGMTPEQRAIATTSQDSNGIVGPSEFQAYWTEYLKGGQGMWTAPITFIDTPTGNDFILPTIDDTANDATIKAEAAAEATNVDATIANLTLRRNRYTSGVCLISERMLNDNYLAIQRVIADQCFNRIIRKVNTDATSGDGSSKIKGLLASTTLGKTAASATAVTFDELIDLMTSVDVGYASASSVGWMCSMVSLGNVMKLKDGAGNYIFQVGAQGGADRIMNRPVYVNNSMPAMTTGLKSFAFGDFSKYYLRRVGTPRIRVLDQLYAGNGQVGVLVTQEFDGVLADTKAVKHLIQA